PAGAGHDHAPRRADAAGPASGRAATRRRHARARRAPAAASARDESSGVESAAGATAGATARGQRCHRRRALALDRRADPTAGRVGSPTLRLARPVEDIARGRTQGSRDHAGADDSAYAIDNARPWLAFRICRTWSTCAGATCTASTTPPWRT